MKTRSFSKLFVVVALLVSSACTVDKAVVAPAAPNPGLVGDLVGGVVGVVGNIVNGLLGCPTSQSYTSTKTIGQLGGTITVGPHSLTVPPGALSSNVTITATAPKGNLAQVQFKPAGLQFAQPAALKMSYKSCLLSGTPQIDVVYIDDAEQIIEVLPTVRHPWTKTVTGSLKHFSAYALAE